VVEAAALVEVACRGAGSVMFLFLDTDEHRLSVGMIR